MVGWYPRLGLATLLVGMTLVAYWPAYQAGFVDFDDSDYVYGNRHVSTGVSGENLQWAFTRYHSSNWHPLTWISHMVDVELFGLDARGHHAVNVGLHAVNAALLFLLFAKMTGNVAASFVLAALFAIHPINVESVAWIAQRKTTLSTLFGILSVWCYVAYAHRRDWRPYVGSLLLFACSLMAKQTLVTLPFALLLLDYWPLNRKELALPAKGLPTYREIARGWRRLFPEKLPFLAIAVLACVVTLIVQQQAMNTIEKYSLETRLGNVAISYVAYLGKLLWPVHLAAFYPLYNEDVTASRVLLAAAILAILTAVVCYFGRERRYLLVGWFWYLGTMIPVIGLVHVGAQAMADRYAYVSFWGLWIIAVWGVRDVWLGLPALRPVQSAGAARPVRKGRATGSGRTIGILGVAGLLSVLGWLTFVQAAQWHDTITLFEDAVADTERNWRAHGILADHYLNRQDYERCLDHCQRGEACGRQLGRLLSTRGMALFDTGATEKAIQTLRRATELEPDNSLAHTNLGWVYSELRKNEQANEELAIAARLLTEASTPYARQTVYANWAKVLAALNRLQDAREKYELALAAAAPNAGLLQSAGEVDLRLGDAKRSLERLQRADMLAPGNAKTAFLLGQTLEATGDWQAAAGNYQRVLKAVPNSPDATLRLAQAYLRLGQPSEAAALLTSTVAALATTKDPSVNVARSTMLTRLGDLAAAQGKRDAAVERYEQALALRKDNYPANNNLAWLLATHADAARRDGQRSLALAQQAGALLKAPNAASLGTLAAALAANGQTEEAVAAGEQALTLANKSNDRAAAMALEAQLKAYRAGQPYVE